MTLKKRLVDKKEKLVKLVGGKEAIKSGRKLYIIDLRPDSLTISLFFNLVNVCEVNA